MKVRDKLIEQINEIDSEELMQSISNMISSLNKNGVFELSEPMKIELESRSTKIASGEFKTHEEIRNKYNNK